MHGLRKKVPVWSLFFLAALLGCDREQTSLRKQAAQKESPASSQHGSSSHASETGDSTSGGHTSSLPPAGPDLPQPGDEGTISPSQQIPAEIAKPPSQPPAKPTAPSDSEPFKIEMSRQEILAFAKESARLEFNNKYTGITMWNKGEDFASIGVGHYLWFPEQKAGKPKPPYHESFPDLIKYMVKSGYPAEKLPKIIGYNKASGTVAPVPHSSKASFDANLNDPQMKELQKWLHNNEIRVWQVKYQLNRVEGMAAQLSKKSPEKRARVESTLKELFSTNKGRNAVLDYINFKGDGVSAPQERVQTPSGEKVGWGLYQAVEASLDKSSGSALKRFSQGAEEVLVRRAKHQPSVAQYLGGWKNRVRGYSD